MRSLHSNLRHKHCQQLKFLSSKIFALQAERSTRKGRGRCRTHGRGWRRCTGLKAGVAYFRDERNYCWYCVPMQYLTSVAVWETTKKHVAMYGETWVTGDMGDTSCSSATTLPLHRAGSQGSRLHCLSCIKNKGLEMVNRCSNWINLILQPINLCHIEQMILILEKMEEVALTGSIRPSHHG